MSVPKIAVVGGGISGLACVYELLKLKKRCGFNFDILLLEAGEKFGGTIATDQRDGFLLEKGADSFLSEKPWARELAEEVGLESEIIFTRNEFRKSFVARGSKLIPLPEGFYLVAPLDIASFFSSPLFSISGKLRMSLEAFIPKRKMNSDESVGSFIVRRFGKEALERVAQAMLAGIYTGDPNELSLRATLPRFFELEQKYGSVIRGLKANAGEKKEFASAQGPRYSMFLSMKSGMESLVRGIVSQIPVDVLKSKSPIKKLIYETNHERWRIETGKGDAYLADAVCISASARVAGELLREVSPEISRKLDSISYESVATINFGFKKQNIQHPLNGFGFVVPAVEKRSIIACSFSSVKFENRAPKDCVLLRAFVGGVFGGEYFNMNDSDLIQSALKDLSLFLGITGKPLFAELARHPKSMVQYKIGHLKLIQDIESRLKDLPGLFLTGSAYHGIGIPDCIHDAQNNATQAVDWFSI